MSTPGFNDKTILFNEHHGKRHNNNNNIVYKKKIDTKHIIRQRIEIVVRGEKVGGGLKGLFIPLRGVRSVADERRGARGARGR